MAEGTEIPGGEPSAFEGSGRPGERDIFAERRALRVAGAPEAVLARRAEAAEATVQTLEAHVASLQARLREAEEERGRMAELLEVEKASVIEREVELRRSKQREYAEQQLRVEAEERIGGTERESRAEIEELDRRFSASEQDGARLAERLGTLERRLAGAEQLAEQDRVLLRRAEQSLKDRVEELELRSSELEGSLQVERSARQRSEALIATILEGQRRMAGVLGEMRRIVERLRALLSVRPKPAEEPQAPAPSFPRQEQAPRVEPRPAPQAPAPSFPRQEQAVRVEPPGVGRWPAPQRPPREGASGERGAEMADALASAVERLRARAETAAQAQAQPSPAAQPASIAGAPPLKATAARHSHKHSASLIARLRNRRKQRRGR